MKTKTTISLIISALLLGAGTHASWFSTWNRASQPLMRNYLCPAWQRTKHVMANPWVQFGIAAAGIGAGCWYYNRMYQNAQAQNSSQTPLRTTISQSPVAPTKPQEQQQEQKQKYHETESDRKRFYNSCEAYRRVINYYTKQGWKLDERHITDTWPQEQIAYLKQHQVSKELQEKLDKMMIDKRLLEVLSKPYHLVKTSYEAHTTINDEQITNLLNKDIIKECGIKFIDWGVFTLNDFPDLIFKMALPFNSRFSEKYNLNRVYCRNALTRYVASNKQGLLETQFTLTIPWKQFYIVPQVPWHPYALTPKVIVVAQRLNLTNTTKAGDLDLSLYGRRNTSDWRYKACKRLEMNGYKDLQPYSPQANVFFKEPKEVIIIDTKAIHLSADDESDPAFQTEKLPHAPLTHIEGEYYNKTFREQYDTCITPHGLVAHKIPLASNPASSNTVSPASDQNTGRL